MALGYKGVLGQVDPRGPIGGWITLDLKDLARSGVRPARGGEAEIDLTYVGGIERGKRNPSLLVMARITDALSVALPKLLNE